MSRNGFSPIIIMLLIIVVLAIAGGVWYYGFPHESSQLALHVATTTPTQTNATTSTLSNVCEGFGALQNYLTKTITAPDATATLQMNPNVITSFKWKRTANEPFVSYPIIQGYEATYNNNPLPTIKNDVNQIQQTISVEVSNLGLVVDNLNTLPFQSFPNQDAYHSVYSFRSGSDLYSLVIRSDFGTQAPAVGTVTITCGRAIPGYDAFYNTLQLKADAAIENPYDNDDVMVQAVSPDNTVYAISGNPRPNQKIGIENYYYFDGITTKLVSANSYPAVCTVLETQKVGLDMRCTGNNSGKVMYAGSQTMTGLNNSNFLAIEGQTSVSPPENGSLAYFWISVGLTLNKTAQCSVDFGDGSSTLLFRGVECSGNSTSSVFHYYASPGTYTAKIIGTWRSGNQQTTEVLTTTTLTTTN